MRSLLLFAASLGTVIAQAGVSTITTTILSTTSSVIGTSTSTLTASSCATSTGTDGQPTTACKNSYVMSPVEVYSQVVVTITTQSVLTVGSASVSSTVADVQVKASLKLWFLRTDFSRRKHGLRYHKRRSAQHKLLLLRLLTLIRQHLSAAHVLSR